MDAERTQSARFETAPTDVSLLHLRLFCAIITLKKDYSMNQRRNSEDTITTMFLDILTPMHSKWEIDEQTPRPLVENERKPDAIVRTTERYPLAVEVKIDTVRGANETGEEQARRHYLGKTLETTLQTITSAIAIRIPHPFRTMPRDKIRARLAAEQEFCYILLSIDEPSRFPESGWLQGSIADIATAITIGATPIATIADAAKVLERGIRRAAAIVDRALQQRPRLGEKIATILVQEPGEQTQQMAMLIISNALVFQSYLSRTPALEDVPSLSELIADYGQLDSDEVLKAWRAIQAVNYAPIFSVAYALVKTLSADDNLVGKVLNVLRNTARDLERMGLAQEHELAGIVFQKLIADRKIIKANYTRPESSALLCALVLPVLEGAVSKGIDDSRRGLKPRLPRLKVADFACGTGSLLNGVYQRIRMLHEQAGGDSADIHQHMLEQNLVGCDILPNAVHLTAAIIASTQPQTRIGSTRIHTMPYGIPREDGLYGIGALNLLSDPGGTLPLTLGTTATATGHGTETTALQQAFRHGEMDIVIQNPPYTRSADPNANMPKNIFADKQVDAAMRASLRAQKGRLSGNNTGLGAHFADLADRMLKRDGKMAFVLPLTAITGDSWHKVRRMWATEYRDVIVISVAHPDIAACAFSADTGMAECLVVATKGAGENTGSASFVCLARCPGGELEAQEIAKQITCLKESRRLDEDVLGGGAPLKLGDETVGHVISARLPESHSGWPVTRVKDMIAVQSAYHLARGVLRLPRQTSDMRLPICAASEIGTLGTGPKDIYGGGGRGAFDVVKGCPDTAQYPVLWHVHSASQRTMVVAPDAHAVPRPNMAEKVQRILKLNSRVHYNLEMQFNANSLAVMFTDRETLGIALIPNVYFTDARYEYAWTLWCNSTFGLLCHWFHSGKQQQGRGKLSRAAFDSMPTLDVRELSDAALANAERIFHSLKHRELRPFNEMDVAERRDAHRCELDGLLLSEVLGISQAVRPDVYAGVSLLRRMLCQEPSINGGKRL